MIRFIPNILTVARLFLSIIFLWMVLYSPKAERVTTLLDGAFVLFLVAALTDVIDGHLARRFNVTSKFGRIVDPLADKVLVCGAFICFAWIGQPRLFGLSDTVLHVIHWTVAGILVLREAYVTIIRQWAESRGLNFAATRSGKIKMLLQSIAIGTVLVKMAHVPNQTWGYWVTSIVFFLMVAATIFSGIRAGQRLSHAQPKTIEELKASP
ncbi:MAG: CDP-alcohol phosphatidyltransferase family protein [Phycisphaerae bacterium]|nr:CDP-alcohol phosphatidyltransferase family protein [Phycisphaerae bacterium]